MIYTLMEGQLGIYISINSYLFHGSIISLHLSQFFAEWPHVFYIYFDYEAALMPRKIFYATVFILYFLVRAFYSNGSP